MENTSKALLIVVAVLIAILVITIGIKIFSSSSEIRKVAMQTGDAISSKTEETTSLAISEIAETQAQSNLNSNTLDQKIGNIIKKENYGEYIDFGKSVVGTSATTDDWRILYNDKKGHVYAILADYIPNNNESVKAAGFTSDKTGTYNVYSSTSRQNLLDRLNNEEAWKTLISTDLQKKGAKVNGATTRKIIMASYNDKYGKSLVSTNNSYLYIDADISKGIDPLYMPHPGSIAYNGCFGYWLASPETGNTYYAWIIHQRGGVFTSRYYDSYCGLRPVVSLPSNIQVTKNGTVWTVV